MANPKSEIEMIASAMRARMPWDVGQKVLTLHGAPRARGWDKTVQRLSETGSEFVAALNGALIEHLFCGEKLVRFYKVSAPTKKKICETIQGLRPAGPFSEVYPVQISENDLSKLKPGKLHIAATLETNDGIGVAFGSIRIVERKIPIDLSNYPEAVSNAFDAFDELYAIEQLKLQVMDIVWVAAKGNFVEVRVDSPREMNHEIGLAAHEIAKSAFNKLAGEEVLDKPSNLFQIINALYGSDEGRVVELAFGTTTASLKHEKMRRKRSCLRKEAYHRGGKAALRTPIEPYRLAIEWDVVLADGRFSQPEINFNGKASMHASAHSGLFEVKIAKCIGFDDFAVVRTIVEKQLAQLPKVN